MKINSSKLIVIALMTSVISGCTSSRWHLQQGQHPQSFEKTIKVKVSGNMLLYLPDAYGKEKKKWPLIVFLHGSGERGTDLELVKKNGPPKIVETMKDFRFVVVSPQAPVDSWWSSDMLKAMIDEVVQNVDVDPERIYLTGLSMGGFGTWALGMAEPGMFAAIAPVCGGGDTTHVCNLKEVPVWAFHGAKDFIVPLASGEAMVNALKRCGGDAKITVYPEAGHDSWTETYENPELYKWFLEHRRKEAQ